jgi:LAS superfamily LD-carboxypeptidase LdcB
MSQLLEQPAAAAARVTSTVRTYMQQKRLYRRFLSGLSPYPAAPPGHSMHELGRAFDLGGLDASELQQLGQTWESWGGRWGGRFGDPIHFEL